MPYKITKKGGKSCVTKSDSGEVIPGGCHKSRDEAVSHLQALYANEAMAAIANSFSEDDDEVQEVDITETAELAAENDEFEVYTVGDNETLWAGNIAFEEESTGDNRFFSKDAITWNDLPLPLLWQKTSSDGHSGSVVVGRVDEMERRENAIFARGVILDTAEGQEYKSLVEAGAAGGVSIDGDSAQYSVEELEGGKHKVNFNSIRIRGLTAVAIPAFANAKISLVTEDSPIAAEFCVGGCPPEGCDHSLKEYKAKPRKRRKGTNLTAAAAPVKPPLTWFQNQNLPGPTPLTILEDGQVYGHLALWGTCHIGMPKCTTPPKGGSYGYFHTGALDTAEGVEISVGHLTFNTGHASIHDNAYNAAAHYDHTGAVAADVTAGEDEFGIWVAGALRPHLTDEEVRAFKSAPLSGDWRRIGAKLELVGALSVNTPGFPVPREKARVLVASGGEDQTFISTLNEEDYDAIGRQTYKEDLAQRVEEFYNTCHDENGRFCEGPDGPGRVRDNIAKAEGVVGKKAPTWMKNMMSRKLGKARKEGEALLPKNAPQYMKDMMSRRMEETVKKGKKKS